MLLDIYVMVTFNFFNQCTNLCSFRLSCSIASEISPDIGKILPGHFMMNGWFCMHLPEPKHENIIM